MDNHDAMQRQPDLNSPAAANGVPQPAFPPAPEEEPEPEITFRQWLARNGITLGIVLLLLGYLFVKFDAEGLWAIGKAALGLSFVIFIHELGHFLVAKWCDVHVTTFSIGFGPAIPGCRFQWGETTYKLALFPLGGYVQMVGQVDVDEASDDEEDPRSYRKKSVWQRMAIISAGVTMNAILAVICFIVVFQIPGKDRQAALVAGTDSSKPAFVEGIRTGAEIVKIGSYEVPLYFEDLQVTVMGVPPGRKVDLHYKFGGKETALEILPQVDKRPLVGIRPADSTKLRSQRSLISLGLKSPVEPYSPAAKKGFAFDDVIVGMTHPVQGDDLKHMALGLSVSRLSFLPYAVWSSVLAEKKTLLRQDPRKPDQRDYFEYARRLQLLAGRDITFVVERQTGEKKETLEIKVPPAFHRTLGVRMEMGYITAVRKKSPADTAGIQATKIENLDGTIKKREGDMIKWVEVHSLTKTLLPRVGVLLAWTPSPAGLTSSVAGVTMPALKRWDAKTLDPLRLPAQLREWAGKVKDMHVILHVKRHKLDGTKEDSEEDLLLKWDASWEFDRVEPMSASAPHAIPELGLAYQVQTTVADELPGKDLAQELREHKKSDFFSLWSLLFRHRKLKKQDEIKDVRFLYRGADGEEWGPWMTRALKRDLKGDEWANIFWRLQSFAVVKVALKVKRGDIVEVEMVPQEDPTWPLEERGLILAPDQRKEKAENVFDAVYMGFRDTSRSMTQIFQNLRGMITGQISVENLGGPVTIARVAYRFAGYDFWEFVFFIGLISINLAVINFLPIPVLDGGHMVFLTYEMIKRKPAPESFRIWATYAGLIFILGLMIFVLYLDFSRIFN